MGGNTLGQPTNFRHPERCEGFSGTLRDLRGASRSFAVLRMTLVFVIAGTLFGCVPKTQKMPAYYGPTEPMSAVIEKINQRNVRLDSLRCAGNFSATIVDPETKKKTSPPDGDVTLLYRPPHDVRLQGTVIGHNAFDMASNASRYWLILPEQDTMWWGYHRLIGSAAASRLPFRPDLIPEVLGVLPLEKDLLKEPSPTMRVNNDARAYMLTWNVLLGDRWAVQKEVWYDVETLLPRLVLLFDANGRIQMRAYLSQYKPVDGYDPAVRLAARYEMFFPESGSTFTLDLTDLRRKYKEWPNDFSFKFPDEDRAGVTKVIQIDE